MRKPITLVVVAGVASLFISAAAQAATGNWIGASGSNWNDSTHWQGGVIPNGQGDVAQYTTTDVNPAGASSVAVNDIPNVTVGTLKVQGTTNHSMQFTPNENIVMNQDGAGPLRAQWINDIQSAGATSNPALFLNAPATGFSGTFVLNDDLFISNTSNSQRTSGSIQVRGPIRGAGNIWIENISNNIGAGQVAFTNNESSGAGAGGFAGNITVAKGAVTFTRGDVFTPSPGNFVTIGSANGGDATLAAVGGGLGNIENNFVAAANTTGTSAFVANPSNSTNVNVKSTNSFAAAVRLDGDLTFDNRATNGSVFIIGDPITGVGQATKIGPGQMLVTNTNSYSGGTVVNGGSLVVGHADAINNGFGFYVATDGTLGSGNVTVNSNNDAPTWLELQSTLATVNVIADTATLSLSGGGSLSFADNGYALLDAGINETVGGLILGGVAQTTPGTYGSSFSGAMFANDEYFSGSGVITLAAPIDADFNNDGRKAGADFLIWQRNQGLTTGASNAQGDANGDGAVNAADLALWKSAFGTAVPAVAGVPEPTAAALMLCGAAAAALIRLGRR
jgi:autotransporter-associated beta strand protein